jgi:peptidyl-prolyl cis-trans isomerase SurA
MNRFFRNAISVVAGAVMALGLCLEPRLAAADVIDRIVATVNGHIILQSDWDETICYEALSGNRKLADFNEEDRRAVLNRLIDQELLQEQTKSSDLSPITDAEIAARVGELRKQYPDATDADSWRNILLRFHLTEKDLQVHIRRQIELMKLVDARLRPAVEIDSKSIEAYYREQFVPKLKQTGAAEVPMAEVSGQIRELLTQQKVGELLVSWLQTLRSESQVNVPGGPGAGADAGVQSP